MAYDKKKSQQVSIRIPHDLWRKIKAHYVAQGIKRLSKNAMIVMILDKWMIEQHPKERIGDGLVRLGKMTREQAENAYQIQKEKYNFTKRFGEIAVELMYINRATLDEYLGDA